MYGHVELLPELQPVQHITIESGNVQLGKLGATLTVGGRALGGRGVSIE